ncbi:MAG: hypothetical protein GX247_03200 [Mollicutes bacterium]|nr:hypothetical protein [Mollicutes bacterium]
MRKINHLLKKYDLKPYQYRNLGKVTFIDTDQGRFVIKEKTGNEDNKIYEYLESRQFNYYPKIINDLNENYEITEFIDEVNMPREQKILDIIELVSLLHYKTTHYKEIDEADYKEIYEDISNNIEYLFSYYNDIASIIETKVYMSPAEYLLIRNISKIYGTLNFCKQEINAWYELIINKRKQRVVVLHNNLELDHFIRNKDAFLISWNKSKIGIPIFDLYKLYKKHALDFEFSEILKLYEKKYPLMEEERKLFFVLIALPSKIEFNQNEYMMCKLIGEEIDSLYKSEIFISPYYAKDTVQNK